MASRVEFVGEAGTYAVANAASRKRRRRRIMDDEEQECSWDKDETMH
jgi:hypothetical protein